MAPPPDPAGEGPPLDFARIMQTLDRYGVEYLLVGGAAVIGYGAQRGTRDVDCMLPRGNALVERAQPQDIADVRIRLAALEDNIASKE